MLFGGNANNELIDGTWYFNANNASSISNVNIDTGNLLTKLMSTLPLPLGKILNTSVCIGTVTEGSEGTRL